jgi:hypothetical protein
MPGDILSGRYPTTNPNWSGFGQAVNATQSNIPVRSNLEWPFLGNLAGQAAALVSGELTVVPVPVDIGNVISKVSILTDATAESTGTHAAAAVYSGALTTAVLQGAQSADTTGATAIGASARYDFTLATPVVVSAAVAPYGYVYVGVTVTGTVPGLVCATIATAAQYAWFTDAPPFFGAIAGSALAGVCPASLTLATYASGAVAFAPVVFLS